MRRCRRPSDAHPAPIVCPSRPPCGTQRAQARSARPSDKGLALAELLESDRRQQARPRPSLLRSHGTALAPYKIFAPSPAAELLLRCFDRLPLRGVVSSVASFRLRRRRWSSVRKLWSWPDAEPGPSPQRQPQAGIEGKRPRRMDAARPSGMARVDEQIGCFGDDDRGRSQHRRALLFQP